MYALIAKNGFPRARLTARSSERVRRRDDPVDVAAHGAAWAFDAPERVRVRTGFKKEFIRRRKVAANPDVSEKPRRATAERRRPADRRVMTVHIAARNVELRLLDTSYLAG